MTRFIFELATPDDDQQLRELLAATPMEGAISVRFERQPSYFDAASVDGAIVQVGVARERDSGRIVGMGSRAISCRYIHGRPMPVGYLSGLRLLPQFRGQAGLLARGYRFLRELHADGAAPFYLTTIAADNERALQQLTRGRAGLPEYHPIGNFYTLALAASCTYKRSCARSNVSIRPAVADDRDGILKFLSECGSTRQFFPAYDAGDLLSGGLLKGLKPEDVLLAFRDNQIVGTLGCWDQRAFKQVVIDGYRGWLRIARPLYNALAKARRRPLLPGTGAVLAARLAAIPVVYNDDRDVLSELLDTMLCRMALAGDSLLLVGLHEADPLLAAVRRYAGREYVTKLYVVYGPDEAPDTMGLIERVPYLELGGL